jgi:hypothetical protein
VWHYAAVFESEGAAEGAAAHVIDAHRRCGEEGAALRGADVDITWEPVTVEAPEDAVFNEAFNVGQTAHNYRIRDLAEIVAKVVPGCTLDFAEGAGPDKRSYRVSFEKIKRKLPAFKPQWDARMGAEQLYKAYKASGVTLEEFEGPRYQRIGHINKLLAERILNADLRHSAPAEQLAG